MDPTPSSGPTATRRSVLAAAAGLATTGSVAGCVALEQPTRATPDTESRETWYRTVYETAEPALVEIAAGAGGNLDGQGSGFHIDPSTVVTNAHVVAGQDRVNVRDRSLEWGTGTVRGEDVYSDLAVVDLADPTGGTDGLPWADGRPQVGTNVMALGAPLGFDGSASTGIVSGVNRALPSPTGFSVPASIQTDAAINPGSSGGPLLNAAGSVVGVVFAGAGENVGFAISAAACRQIVPELAAGNRYEHTYVGIAHYDVTPQVAAANDLEPARGVYVDEVIPESPAAGNLQGTSEERVDDGTRIGVGGDIILAVDGTDTPTGDHLGAYLLLEAEPDETVTFTVVRDGTERSIDVTLGVRPLPEEIAPTMP